MKIRLAGITAITILLVGSISIGLFALKDKHGSETQSATNKLSAQKAFIDPVTGKLTSQDKSPRTALSTTGTPEAPQSAKDLVPVYHEDGSVSVDTRNYKQKHLQATIGCDSKIQFTHTDKSTNLPVNKPCKGASNAKN